MAYCTQTDIINHLSKDKLISLTDDSGSGKVNTTILNAIIADADNSIDSLCTSRYTVPFSPVPEMIKRFSIQISIYMLNKRRKVEKLPEPVKNSYMAIMKQLREIDSGGRSIPNVALKSISPPILTTNKKSTDRIFTKELLATRI